MLTNLRVTGPQVGVTARGVGAVRHRATGCSVLLSSATERRYILNFTEFDMGEDGIIQIYDGSTGDAPLLNSYRGNYLRGASRLKHLFE